MAHFSLNSIRLITEIVIPLIMIFLVSSFLVQPKITTKADRQKYDAYWSALFIHRDFSQMGIGPSKRIDVLEYATIVLHIGNPFTPDTNQTVPKISQY